MIANTPLSDKLLFNGKLLSVDLVLEVGRALKNSVPPCVTAGLHRSWFNSSCTSFKVTGSTCVFGCNGCKDAVKHYVICPKIWRCASVVLKLDNIQLRTSRSLLASPCLGESLERLALHNYAAYGAYNWICRHPADADKLLSIYNERVRKAAETAKIIRELWAA